MRIWLIPPAGGPLVLLSNVKAGPHKFKRQPLQNIEIDWMNSPVCHNKLAAISAITMSVTYCTVANP